MDAPLRCRIASDLGANRLREAVAAGTFRADLFYRINVLPLRIPPLRDRRADIPLLMDHFLARFWTQDKKAVTGFDEQAVSAMLSYDWPGNVRELENMVPAVSSLDAVANRSACTT